MKRKQNNRRVRRLKGLVELVVERPEFLRIKVPRKIKNF